MDNKNTFISPGETYPHSLKFTKANYIKSTTKHLCWLLRFSIQQKTESYQHLLLLPLSNTSIAHF
ncbi:Putative protein [Zobellia galactanivorans]|uniref:Uncharacterized protein n=1 Tax=Zobellia galactanivorans (strain DSM 12802 / CCUG 47099 / CIP 106680 / NCIMB 13871 / Dsij) TaxID=63186 RepID=G0L613_ZOBGA|nr:Putative protein [Zobellia galactanivorans]